MTPERLGCAPTHQRVRVIQAAQHQAALVAGEGRPFAQQALGGSDALRGAVRSAFREFGVATYHKSEVSPGGELSQIYTKAPSFHIIDHVTYHTTLDTADLVPAWGLEDATRAFLKIIDTANHMTRQEIAAAPQDLADRTKTVR